MSAIATDDYHGELTANEEENGAEIFSKRFAMALAETVLASAVAGRL